MIINRYQPADLQDAFGIEMSSMEGLGVGAGWGRVAPGSRSDRDRHDETETLVIVQGAGDLIVDGRRVPVGAGTVVQFEPFDAHVIENTGETDLVFATFYWRDPARAAAAAGHTDRVRLGDRPLFVFSTPPTPNGDLHLGHLSGPYLGADAFVRFQRMNGAQAWHLTGSDDYQSYVVECARRAGGTPAQTAAHYSAEIAATLDLMDIPLDQYTVTNADPAYPDGLRAFFSRLVASGSVAPKRAPGLFDATGAYRYEVDVAGGCPTCGGGTGGNICEECGEPNSCVDLVDPQVRGSDAAPRAGEVTRFMLPLHEFGADLAAHHRLGRVPARLRELADRILRRSRFDVAMTHPSSWGVPPRESDVDGQVIWVWPEMSYGFLHGIQALGGRLGHAWRADAPQADWKIVHFFGYDNSFYHAILYPVLYRLAYPDWAPDIDYHVNEFLLLDGAKFSTSRRHAIWGKEILNPGTVDGVRYYLSRIRSEGRRTNFERPAYESVVRTTLIGTWQRWLNDLGERIDKHHGGQAPDAGLWTPEHTGFLNRLGVRLSALTDSLGADGFSLNRAAEELTLLVDDAVRFSRSEGQVAHADLWRSPTRTAIALELAAAKLLATCAAPVMPRFAGRLSAALNLPEPPAWPQTVTLVAPGSRVDLARQVFFADPAAGSAGVAAAGSAGVAAAGTGGAADGDVVVSWLSDRVREAVQLPGDEPVADRTLVALGAGSLQAVALQYQILSRFGTELLVDDLLGGRTVAQLAALIEQRAATEVAPA